MPRVLLLALLLLASSAAAQPVAPEGYKSVVEARTRALLFTALPTAGGLALFLLDGGDTPLLANVGASSIHFGLIAGPSMGDIYAGGRRRAVTGALVRTAAYLPVAVTATLYSLEELGGAFDGAVGTEPSENRFESALLTTGALWVAVSAASAAWQIATVDRSVRAYNERFAVSLSPGFNVAARAPTLRLAVRF